MNREESKEYCIELLKRFIKEKLNGDINQICMFDLTKLEEDSTFGKPSDYPSDRVMDSDDSLIARAVLYLLFYEEIEELTINGIGYSKDYRGDTLFTPGNLLGKPIDILERNEKTCWKHINDLGENEKIQHRIDKFLDDYHTLSNITLLPNKRIKVVRKSYGNINESSESINNYRGMNHPGFSDYVDMFLFELEKCITRKGTDEYLKKLIMENEFYFKRYDNNFQGFCNSHFFQVFYVDENVSSGLKEEYKFQHYVRWIKPNNAQVSYSDEIENYINGFEEMRKFRNKKMVEKLESIIKLSRQVNYRI